MLERVLLQRKFGKKIRLVSGRESVCNIFAVLTNVKTGAKRFIPGANIVTNDGDIWYAKRGANETDHFTVVGNRLGTAVTPGSGKTSADVTTFLAGSGKAIDGTYPKTNDDDGDNTGAGVDINTWRISYGTSEGNGSNITEGAIVDNITTPTKALTHYEFAAPFTKTSSDTLKIFVNHEMSGQA